VAVNLLGNVAVMRAALPVLKHAAGHVVMVGSTLGLRALSDATAYCASKFGMTGFTRVLAVETAGRVGVTVGVPSVTLFGPLASERVGAADRPRPARRAVATQRERPPERHRHRL
jgi:NAD(P)-dependent dehydrogenase (short-subunit alcohol dehydrogenase family)